MLSYDAENKKVMDAISAFHAPVDCVIREMKYSAYKKHYADCKTVYNSYHAFTKTVYVVIPEGREKTSGTRGERYNYFSVMVAADDGKSWEAGIKAMTWENALKQIKRNGWHIVKSC